MDPLGMLQSVNRGGADFQEPRESRTHKLLSSETVLYRKLEESTLRMLHGAQVFATLSRKF